MRKFTLTAEDLESIAPTPAARHEAARILTAALTDWATAPYER